MEQGTWDPADQRYNSLAMWDWTGPGSVLEFRLPWSMLGLGDPSSHAGVVPDAEGLPVAIDVPEIPFTIDPGSGPEDAGAVTWDAWNQATYTERLKDGWQDVRDAFVDVSG